MASPGSSIRSAAQATSSAYKRLPIRWRLAGGSAVLTLVILLVFGAVIGQVATSRIRDDFNRQVSSAAQTLAAESRVFSTAIGTIYRGVTPFIIADLALLAILAAFPAISLWLPAFLAAR